MKKENEHDLPDLDFVLIEPSVFIMGSNGDEKGRYEDEVQHEVILTKGFYLQTTPVTQRLWNVVMDMNPSRFVFEDHPVENISWLHAVEFIDKLNKKDNTNNYRLPTEAEWEYACRAGSNSVFCFGDDLDEDMLGEYAWYWDTSNMETHPVGLKKPNAWGLYDMHGNVNEWCQDWYGDYPVGSVTDPKGPLSGERRMNRGGSWGDYRRNCRSASRNYDAPDSKTNFVGLRLVKSL